MYYTDAYENKLEAGTANATYNYKLNQYKDSLDGGFVKPGVSSKLAAIGGVSSEYPDVVSVL